MNLKFKSHCHFDERHEKIIDSIIFLLKAEEIY